MHLQAAAGEKAAAEEAAKMLQRAREEPNEMETPEDGEHKPVKEKRLVMQAMHVPHDKAGSILIKRPWDALRES